MNTADVTLQEAMQTIMVLQTRITNLAVALAESQEQLVESKKLLEVSREVVPAPKAKK